MNMDRRLRFQRRIEPGDDGHGNHQGDWADVCEVAAEVLAKPAGANEDVLQARLSGIVPYTIRVWQSSLTNDLDAECRAIDARDPYLVFNIRSKVDVGGMRRLWTMDAETGVVT